MASYQNDEQTIANKGIFYKHPTPGSIQMVMDTAGIDPATPGTVTTDKFHQKLNQSFSIRCQCNGKSTGFGTYCSSYR